MYNPNNPSNWSWSKAFDEMEKTVNQAELTQQIITTMTVVKKYSNNLIKKIKKKCITS